MGIRILFFVAFATSGVANATKNRTGIRRRRLLQAGLATTASVVVGGGRTAGAQPAQPGASPYGSLEGREPDDNDIVLPEGFRSRVLARSGETVEGTELTWHGNPDGGAVFPTTDEGDGWVYVSNSETGGGQGGVSALRFDADGEVAEAYPILSGTRTNCAGGPTPWGTWLSCEEVDDGQVFECDPTRSGQGAVRPALGTFSHEAVAVDPEDRKLYLTEDKSDGRFYRFTPSSWPDLTSGALEVAVVAGDTSVTWAAVPDPAAADTPTRQQVPDSTGFAGGEGIWYDEGVVFFTTKYDNRVHALDVAEQRLEVLYDAALLEDPPLTGVDNVVVSASGDLVVAEDGGEMQLVLITPERVVAPLLRIEGHDDSEVTGPAFDPSGTRLYFSSQRGTGDGGITYEVTGPFRVPATTTTAVPGPTTTLAGIGEEATGDGDGDDDGIPVAVPVGAAAVGAALLGALAWRRRGARA